MNFSMDALPGSQASIEWLMERNGFCTASRFKDVLDILKNGGEGAKRRGYRLETVVSRLTERPVEHFVNDAMLWGTEHEPMARMAYEAKTGAMVEETGFIRHPTLEWVGGSPDGVISDDGGLEIKCPNSTTHLTTILSGQCEHLPQIHGLMWITGRQWWDFVSYDPRMPDGLRLYVKRIVRDEEYIAKLEAEVIQFIGEVDKMVRLAKEIVSPPKQDEEYGDELTEDEIALANTP